MGIAHEIVEYKWICSLGSHGQRLNVWITYVNKIKVESAILLPDFEHNWVRNGMMIVGGETSGVERESNKKYSDS